MSPPSVLDSSVPEAYRRLLAANGSPEPMRDVAAVILAAGRGRRLAPLTDTTPKPLLPVLGLPMLLWCMAQLHRAGVGPVCSNVWHRAAAFRPLRDLCGTVGPRLRLVREESLGGPLGGVLSCRAHLPEAADYLIVSGDALSDIDLRALVGRHRAHGADLTLAVQAVPDASRFGVLALDTRGRVSGMREKPEQVGATEPVYAGVSVMSRDLLAGLTRPETGPYDFVDLVASLVARGRPPATYRHDGFWSDVGTRGALRSGNLAYLRTGRVARVADGGRGVGAGEVWGAGGVRPDTRVAGRALLGPGVEVGRDVVLDDCVIGSGCRIGDDVTVRRSVVLPGARVRPGERVVEDVVAGGAVSR